MKKYWRITCTVFLMTIFLLLNSLTVSAKKEDWIDKTYKFSDVQNVLICKIDDSVISALDDALDEEIQLRGRKFEKKLKRPILDEDSEQLADIKIVTKIIQWKNSSRYVPEKVYYEGWETITTRDRDGKEKKERHHKRSTSWFEGGVKKVIPAYYVPVSEIEVSFEVYDTKSGKLVMSRKDKRDRDGKSEHKNMFERSCKAFFSKLGKKLK